MVPAQSKIGSKQAVKEGDKSKQIWKKQKGKVQKRLVRTDRRLGRNKRKTLQQRALDRKGWTNSEYVYFFEKIHSFLDYQKNT